MKKLLISALSMLAVAMSFTACSSNDDDFEMTDTETKGTAYATGPNAQVGWVQLWAGGPKFAEYNVGATSATDYGGYYCWGKTIDKDEHAAYNSGGIALSGTDDTATNLWGSNWRMPTQAELKALLNKCNVEWTAVNGVNGRKFTGRGDYSSNSVLLPAAGDCDFGNVFDQGNCGDYWSSTPAGSEPAYRLRFRSDYQRVYDSLRDIGYSVRAVLKED